jgi:hypothetical protein
MLISTLPMMAIVVPTVCFLVAAWPLVLTQRFRPVLAGVGGSGCVGLGTAIVGLLAGGLVQFPGASAAAWADEKGPETVAASQPIESPAEAIEVSKGDPQIEAPAETVEIPPGRPKWVGAEPNLRGKIHTVPVSSGPYATDPQAKRALDEALVKATNEYIVEQLGSELAPTLLRYDARTIKERFVKEENRYHDVARYSVGWMHEQFALVEFGPDFRKELDARWTKVRATSRLAQTGLVSGAALALLASVFGYFRLDNATRGYYTGRLQFMTAAAILAVVGAGAVIAQWIHWL